MNAKRFEQNLSKLQETLGPSMVEHVLPIMKSKCQSIFDTWYIDVHIALGVLASSKNSPKEGLDQYFSKVRAVMEASLKYELEHAETPIVFVDGESGDQLKMTEDQQAEADSFSRQTMDSLHQDAIAEYLSYRRTNIERIVTVMLEQDES